MEKQFDRLASHTVYIRRGSSTDIATPDEVAEMGQVPSPSPILDIQFGDPITRELLGAKVEIRSLILDPILADEQLPRVKRDPLAEATRAGFEHVNQHFYEELRDYLSVAPAVRRPHLSSATCRAPCPWCSGRPLD